MGSEIRPYPIHFFVGWFDYLNAQNLTILMHISQS